jgi:hypothetical protein
MNNRLNSILARTTLTPSGCMEWQGAMTKRGYAKIKYGRETWCGHRLVKFLQTGLIGAVALHHCDNRKCVNPDHVSWGTQKENIRDMVMKGRCALSKLTPPLVAEIRHLYTTGLTQKQIATRFNVSQTNVSGIVLRKTWVLVPPSDGRETVGGLKIVGQV